MKRVANLLLAAALLPCMAGLGACGWFEPSAGGDPTYSAQDGTGSGGTSGPQETVSPLAVLETIDVKEAFGDREQEGWSFALQTSADVSATYEFRWTSGISGKEKFYAGLTGAAALEDIVGMRSSDRNDLGVDLFGGGSAGLEFRYTGPKSDAEPLTKDFTAGFRHDGDLVWYAGADGTEHSLDRDAFAGYLDAAMHSDVLARLVEAAQTIPAEIEKGFTLRVAVEKLIDLGFTVEIDDSDGLTVRISADEGFFTDLLNDTLASFLPDEWVQYIPRTDFRYTSTVFDVTLAFDADGLFKEYSVQSSVDVGLTLKVPALFECESGVGVSGGFSVKAYTGEVPADGGEEEEGGEAPAPGGEEGEEAADGGGTETEGA